MAIGALLVGAIQFALKKGTGLHRILGYIWVVSMATVAVSGLFIHQIRLVGPFSPIHLLSLFTLYTLWSAIRAARRGDIDKHAREMKTVYFLGLLVAGAFTFFPGRVMHTIVFGS